MQMEGTQIVIRIFTQLVEKGSDAARTHFVELSGIAPGSYEVYYESAGDPAKRLGWNRSHTDFCPDRSTKYG